MSEEVAKSGLVDWDTVDLPKQKNKINYLRLKSGNTYIVRLFHKPKPVLRYYYNGKSAICGNPDTCPIAIKYPNIKAKSRYAIIVLDRGDNNAVKILEAPAGVFKDFRKFFEANSIDPGGNEGPDFLIKVTGDGINTRYEVSYKMGSKPFTDSEKEAIKAARASGYNLDVLFAPTPADKIESVIMGGGDDNGGGNGGNSNQRTQSQAPATVAAATPVAASKGEFDWAN